MGLPGTREDLGAGAPCKRGSTLDGYNVFFKQNRKSAIFGVWAVPEAPETLRKGVGASPPTSNGRVSRAPGAAQTPKMTDVRPLKI